MINNSYFDKTQCDLYKYEDDCPDVTQRIDYLEDRLYITSLFD